MFSIECSKCKKTSPPMVTTTKPPEGWSQVSAQKGISTETTFRCPECKEEK